MEKDIEINGQKYVLASSVKAKREDVSKDKYVIVRTYSAGVFAGFLKDRKGKEATLRDARRIWYWEGANTLSDLAMVGTTKPVNCKFPAPVDEVILTEAIEILSVTAKARASIESMPAWVK